MTLSGADARAFERCMAAGGVAVFPSDTVYGLACAPDHPGAVERLYALKGRPPDKPAAVMFFALDLALGALGELGMRTAGALAALLPGAITVLLPNPGARFALACGPAPETLGLRVPELHGALEALAQVRGPVLQTSANPAGGTEARRLEEVEPALRRGADLVLDAGELPGIASTVVDLRSYERDGAWDVVRQGAVSRAAVASALSGGPAAASRPAPDPRQTR